MYSKRGILLDRDGVINRERVDYVKCWDEFDLLPGAIDAICQLSTLQAPIMVITNQSAIGRGLASRQVIDTIHARLRDMVYRAGGRIDAFFLCPHTPDDGCACRKPQPGLILKAAECFQLDLRKSIFVGDALTDHQAAVNADCQSLLVTTGRRRTQVLRFVSSNPAVHWVADLPAAAEYLRDRWH